MVLILILILIRIFVCFRETYLVITLGELTGAAVHRHGDDHSGGAGGVGAQEGPPHGGS